MSTTVGAHSGAGPLSLMSCVRESSPLQDFEPEIEKNVVSKRKFWNPRKWFRKKQKTGEDTAVHSHHQDHREVDGTRSRSTGELSTDEEPPRSHEVRNSTSMHPGLSVSHDSVFHPLNSGSSDLELDGAQSSSSLSISQPLGDAKLQTELSSRLRLRRGRGDTSEDDEGLPRSPPCGSPAAATDSFLILEKTANKDLPTKSHSTCSDGSLLSMDSSEMEEDSVGLQSRHSSKVSLNERRTEIESDLELGPSFTTTPLNHSAAHHKVSVRPKRTYGAPRRKKGQLSSALPATPEVNEESSTRSISPDSITTEPITELYSTARSLHHRTTLTTSHSHYTATGYVANDVKFKCNSLPAGATPPTAESLKQLSRSKSNAGKSQDDSDLHGEEREEKLSLFERWFIPRRSGKKKKKDEKLDKDEKVIREKKMVKMEVDGSTGAQTRISEEKKSVQVFSTTPTSTKTYSEQKTIISRISHTKREDPKPQVAPRTGAAARQRIQPMDIPITPKDTRDSTSFISKSPISPDKSFSPGTSPIQLELENVLRQRQISHLSSSPKEPILDTPPETPKPVKFILASTSPVISKKELTSYSSHSSYTSKTTTEDIRSKVKIAGLSSLQQRVLSLNSAVEEEEEDTFKSLTDFQLRPTKPVSKSHSFKSQKSIEKSVMEVDEDEKREKRKSVTKAASMDSVKNLEEPVLKSELKLTLKPVEKVADKIVDAEVELRAKPKPFVSEKVTSEEIKSPLKSIISKEEKVTPDEVNSPLSPVIKNTTPKEERLPVLSAFAHKEFKLQEKVVQSSPVRTPEEIQKFIKPLFSRTDDREDKTHQVLASSANTVSSKLVEEHSVTSNIKPTLSSSFSNDSITISGPSHTAVVNVTSKSEDLTKSSSSIEKKIAEKDESKTVLIKENQVSVTKIHLKHETTQVTKTSVTVPKQDIPEFLNKQLNKVEARPSSNIIFSMNSPKIVQEDTQNVRPKTLFTFPNEENDIGKSFLPRKFSKEDVEIIEKDSPENKDRKDESPPKTPTIVTPVTPTQSRYKKNDSRPSSRKSSVISITTPDSPGKEAIREVRALKSRSISLDSLKSDHNNDSSTPDKSSQDSLDKSDRKNGEGVVLRRKSLVRHKNEDEPELMKVFARRSLKLKDNEVEQIQEAIAEEQRHRDSDKENNTETTPEPEKKLLISPKEEKIIPEITEIKVAKQEIKTPTKQPLTEIKKSSDFIKNIAKEEPEVQLRRSFNNNVFLANNRTVSLNNSSPKTIVTDFHVKKQASLNERRKTDQWVTVKKEETLQENKVESEIITNINNKNEETKTETKNFSQRRAEWEKRVQQAQK